MLSCGLLGAQLAHSYSPQIHAELCDYPYRLYERTAAEIPQFLQTGDWSGINVTIPYKKTVLPYCDCLSDTARQTGSVNTLVRQADGRLYGDNTDVSGFLAMVRHSGLQVSGKKTLVLGSGGAAASVCAALRLLNVTPTVISRTGEDNYANLSRHRDAQIIVNATPVGMYPHNGASPVDLRAFPHCEGVLDLIYNPARTALLLQAETLHIPCANGLYMLVAQAKRSAELFSGKTIADTEIDRVETKLARRMRNLILIGMPGCGKTTLAQLAGALTGRPVLDADAVLSEKLGMTIPAYLRTCGEAAFRDLETETLAALGKLSGYILATGGGCVLRAENYPLLHQNGCLVWVQRDPNTLPTAGRPLSQACPPTELYRQREPYYRRFADAFLDNNASPDTAARILAAQWL